ncbi:putative uncharacterized protein [Parachlamydia acanthamoebae UV-7]|jgi:glycosyltransferase involved in cell wall biosynthesis|uniref:Glycosyltransferase 2-like domain-containing protein n=2 Tax=Parachlamydia acanthamoebae TaxID=83552 RepID=F8KZ49_PARAV|nr:glycosyltransferase [Parachlamydia acanthamoebae]CCB86172.1 putative uncharacterized protein [Parachlamydia acanthamoebae UV-7]
MIDKSGHIYDNTVNFSSDFQNPYPYEDYAYPKVTIVVPTFNCVHTVSLTLDHILNQLYPRFEIVVVDAGSKDRTLEVIKNYRDERIRIFSVSGYHRYEMLNKGIAQAEGEYLNCLFPGDFYLGRETLKYMMMLALNHQSPDLVFCGTFLRNGRSEPKTLFRHLNLKLLKMGQQPTSLQSCWFKTDTLKVLGKFNTSYKLRGGYELLCRFILNRRLKSISTNRVLTDYDLRLVTRRMVLTHFYETMKTVFHYFGLYATFRWLCRQKDILRFLKLWLRNVRGAFLGN